MKANNMTKKVLIVDDEKDIIKVVLHRIKGQGYDVITALTGEEALEKVKQEIPDLILLDLRLPGISGGEVCEKLKSDERYKHIPIIFLTASESANFETKCKQWGAESYVSKPFDAHQLQEVIEEYIK